jgi:hypothetical protein
VVAAPEEVKRCTPAERAHTPRAGREKRAQRPRAFRRRIVREDVLENLYDTGTWYDWFNQRALGGPIFIAPNLRDVPLPPIYGPTADVTGDVLAAQAKQR